MSSQVARLSEPFVAVWIFAHVGLLAGMRSQMGPQVEVERESLIAERTFERLLARVDQLMSLELRVVKESLVATLHRADVLTFAMSHKMLSEGRRVLEELATAEDVARVNFTAVI